MLAYYYILRVFKLFPWELFRVQKVPQFPLVSEEDRQIRGQYAILDIA